MAVKVEAERAGFTVKISRVVRDHIEDSTTLQEPTDRTLRRMLGLKLQKGDFPKKAKKAASKKVLAPWTTIKITEMLKNFITDKASWNESVDHTLRRLLKLKQADSSNGEAAK